MEPASSFKSLITSLNCLRPLLNCSDYEKPVDQRTSIIDLNDDCLSEIISQLELEDQISLVCSHSRFLSAFDMYGKLKFASVKIDDLKLSKRWQFQKFFMYAGNYIKSFMLTMGVFHKIPISLADLDQFCKAHCPNLEVLFISNFSSSHVCTILSEQRELKRLILHDCHIDNQFWPTIANMQQLKEIEFIGCNFNEYTRLGFNACDNLYLPNLKNLQLKYCYNFTFMRFFKNLRMPALNTLTIWHYGINLRPFAKRLSHIWEHLNDLNFDCPYVAYQFVTQLKKFTNQSLQGDANELAMHLPEEIFNQIESLSLNCDCMHVENLISNFKNLKFVNYMNSADNLLIPLHSIDKLEQIDLVRNVEITNHGLLELLKHCHTLKYVNIQFTNIDNNFTNALLPMLRENKRPNGQLILYAFASRIIEENLPEEYTYVENKELVKFVFQLRKTSNFDEDFWNCDCTTCIEDTGIGLQA